MHIDIKTLPESELPEADRIFRVAFGTFIGMPDPQSFMAGADFLGTRWRASSTVVLAAYCDGKLAGSNVVTSWGSFGFFGPLTVRPELWDKGVAKSLLVATLEAFAGWHTRHTALFTFPSSPRHIGLYQKFGYWPQQLTMVMTKPVMEATGPVPVAYASLSAPQQNEALAACRLLTEALFPGLDVTGEIRAVVEQRIGDCVLLYDDAQLIAFAVCHLGAGSEAGPGAAYVKFAVLHPAYGADSFGDLIAACESLAAARGATTVTAGVNSICHSAYLSMLGRGFRTQLTGVAMQSGNALGLLRPECFVLADWR